jgi:hypothetical protein
MHGLLTFQVANVKGNGNLGMQAHTHKGETKSFGPPRGAAKPNSSTFLKRGTGTSYNARSTLPESTESPSNLFYPLILAFAVHHENSLEKYYSESRKEAIPKKEDKPIMGLRSDKNFIVSNAVDNITAGNSTFAWSLIGLKGTGWLAVFERSLQILKFAGVVSG